MDIGMILAHRYPNALPATDAALNDGDYFVGTDDEGKQYIGAWNAVKLGTQPTTDQLRNWWLPAEKHIKKQRLAVIADAEYGQMLSPEGVYTRIEKDEILEKKAAIRAGVNVPLSTHQQKASDSIDLLRQKRLDKFVAVNQVTQGAAETLEQAVERVRVISW